MPTPKKPSSQTLDPKMEILEKKLGINFKDQSLLHRALVHRSYINEHRQEKESNERLEFLGDSVLSVIVSTKLFNDYPSYPEGKLTNLRSSLVRAKTLAQIAQDLDLGQHLLMSKGEENSSGRTNRSLLADCCEAVIGAIYLDQGLDAVKKFLDKYLFPLIDSIQSSVELTDFKSTLQETIQNDLKVSPVYQVVSETGPDHAKIFSVVVLANELELGRGEGKSKQEAEQMAAKHALENRQNIS